MKDVITTRIITSTLKGASVAATMDNHPGREKNTTKAIPDA